MFSESLPFKKRGELWKVTLLSTMFTCWSQLLQNMLTPGCVIDKGQKRNPYCEAICWPATRLHRPEFLGQRLLCINFWSWRRNNSSVHTEAGRIRQQDRSNEHVQITATFGWPTNLTALSGSQSILRLCRRSLNLRWLYISLFYIILVPHGFHLFHVFFRR